MPVPSHLHRRLQDILGGDAAGEFLSMIERMDANPGDVGELRHEMQLGFARIEARFQQVDARFEQMDARFAELNARWVGIFETGQAKTESLLERGLREQTRFFFLAWSVLLAAFVGLYAR